VFGAEHVPPFEHAGEQTATTIEVNLRVSLSILRDLTCSTSTTRVSRWTSTSTRTWTGTTIWTSRRTHSYKHK